MIKRNKISRTETIKNIGIFSWSMIGLIIILAGIFYVISLMQVAIMPAIIGIFIAYMLLPIVTLLRKKLRKVWAVTITFIIFLAIVFVLFFFIIPSIIGEFKSFAANFPFYISRFSIYIHDLLKDNLLLKNIENISGASIIPSSSFEVTKFIINRLDLNSFNVLSGATNITRYIFNIILNFLIAPILSLYILKDSDKFILNLIKIIPLKLRMNTVVVINRINNVFKNYIRGQIIDAFIVAALAATSLLLLKVEFASLLGLTTFVFSLIPLIGPIIAVIPAALMGLLSSPFIALIVLIIFVSIYLINFFFISGFIIKNKTAVHPGIVLFSLIAGWSLFGLIGIFFAIPVVAIIQEIIKYYLIDKAHRKVM